MQTTFYTRALSYCTDALIEPRFPHFEPKEETSLDFNPDKNSRDCLTWISGRDTLIQVWFTSRIPTRQFQTGQVRKHGTGNSTNDAPSHRRYVSGA
jgi:hypothetical protein